MAGYWDPLHNSERSSKIWRCRSDWNVREIPHFREKYPSLAGFGSSPKFAYV